MLDGWKKLDWSQNVLWIIEKLDDVHTSDLIIACIHFEALKLGKQFKGIEFVSL